jgi:hypothetical protein
METTYGWNYEDCATKDSRVSRASILMACVYFLFTYDRSAKLLLVLASTVIFDTESHGTHGHILVSDGAGSLQRCPHALSLTRLIPCSSPVRVTADQFFLAPGILRIITRIFLGGN